MNNFLGIDNEALLELCRVIIDGSNRAICVCDPYKSEVLFMNKSAERIFDFARSEVRGSRCYSVLMHKQHRCENCPINGDFSQDEEELQLGGRILGVARKKFNFRGRDLSVEYFQDITNEKILEKRSKEQSIRLESVISNLPGTICLYRWENGITIPLVISQKISSSGDMYAPADVSGKNKTLNKIHENDRERLINEFAEGVTAGGDFALSFRYSEGNDNDYAWINLDANAVLQDDGSRLIFIIATDVTLAKMAEARLKLEETNSYNGDGLQISSSVFNASTGMVMNHDPMSFGGIHAVEGMPAEVVTNDVARLICDSEDKQKWYQLRECGRIVDAYNNGINVESLDFLRAGNNGAKLWTRNTLAYHLEPNTEDVIVDSRIYDIDSIVMNESIVRNIVNYQYEFVAAIDKNTKLFALVESRNGSGNDFKTGDDYISTVLKYLASRMSKADFDGAAHAIELDKICGELENVDCYTCTATLKNPVSGENSRKSWRYSYLDKKKGLILVTGQDAGQTNIAKSLNGAKSVMITDAGIFSPQRNAFLTKHSHGIISSLNSIAGMGDLAAKSAEANEYANVIDYAKKIGITSRLVLRDIENVLDIGYIEKGEFDIVNKPFSIADLLEDVNSAFLGKAQEKEIEFRCVKGADLSEFYSGDEKKICRVLLNLLSNSVCYTAAGDYITLKVSEGRREKSKAWVRFAVTDSGSGISEEYLPHIFDLFSKNNMDANIANGIGLYICNLIVNTMGGEIRVHSIKNVGSEFVVNIPLETLEGDLSSESHETGQPVGFAGKRILLVEDQPMSVEIVTDLLESAGFTVDVATTALEAIEFFVKGSAGHYCAILMDVSLPIMDGLTLAACVRRLKSEDAVTIPIIAVKTNAYSFESEKEGDTGISAYITRPIDRHQLFVTLKRLIK